MKLKKTRFFILVSGKEKAMRVDGYFIYIDGVAVGLHRNAAGTWTASELSTGLKFTDGPTRAAALENAVSMLDFVREKIALEQFNKARETIRAAYAA